MNNKLGIAILSVVIAIVTAMTTVLLGYAPLLAQQTRTTTFTGFWQGVDEVDGGYSVRAILPADSGFKVVGRDTWHGPCGYGDPAVVLAQLTLKQGTLEGSWKLDCQSGNTAESGDRSFKVRYTFDSATQTMTETLLDAQTEQPIKRIPIVFFRMNPRS